MEEGHFFANKCPFFRLKLFFLPPIGGKIDFIDKLSSAVHLPQSFRLFGCCLSTGCRGERPAKCIPVAVGTDLCHASGLENVRIDKAAEFRPVQTGAGFQTAELQHRFIKTAHLFGILAKSAVVVGTVRTDVVAAAVKLHEGVCLLQTCDHVCHVADKFLTVPLSTEIPDTQSVVGTQQLKS